MRGDFGDYLRKSLSSTDFFTPVPGQQVKKVLPDPDKISPDNVGKVSILIYKRKQENIHTVGPLSPTSSFLIKNDNGKTMLTASTLKTSESGQLLQL